MSKIKVLNLYACLGGNRYKWDEVADIEVTAVEFDEQLANLYQDRFVKDKVIVDDAHNYLLQNYERFDFIWSSPPCPTHSKMRKVNTGKGERKSEATYPDLKLYQEIILLKHFFKGKYCVENVIPFYNPLIGAKKRGRHFFWTNFNLPYNLNERKISGGLLTNDLSILCKFHDFNFKKYTGKKRTDVIARNLVDYEVGKTIFETALGIIKDNNREQIKLF